MSISEKAISTTVNWTQISDLYTNTYPSSSFPFNYKIAKLMMTANSQMAIACSLVGAIVLMILFYYLSIYPSPRIPEIRTMFCVMLGSLAVLSSASLLYLVKKQCEARKKIAEDEANPNHPFLLSILNQDLEERRNRIKNMQSHLEKTLQDQAQMAHWHQSANDSIEKLKQYLVFE